MNPKLSFFFHDSRFQVCSWAFGLFVVSFISAVAQPDSDKPNILWITCEDITPTLGCYGDPVVDTPNIDWLASQGIRYNNAFSVAGVCAPSRHALISGMYPISTGGCHMRTVYNMAPGLPDYSVVMPDDFKCFSEWLRIHGYYCTNNAKTDYQFVHPPSAWDECDQDASWRKRPAGKPFFAVINFLTTHESRIWTQSDEPLLVDELEVTVPPYLADTRVIRRDVARKYSNITEMDRQVGIILEQLRNDGLLDKTIIFFFSDHGGMLMHEKRELYDTGLRVPLIIRFPDGRRAGTVEDEMVSFVDFAPTVLSLAGMQPPGYMQGQAFLGEYRSAEPRHYIFGARDRMDSEYDRVRAARDQRFKYLRNYHPELPYVQNIAYREQIRGMVELRRLFHEGKLSPEAALWWRNTKPGEELFDTWEDPYEFHNLAEDPQYQGKLEELRTAMDEWISEVGDLGAIPESELIFERFWHGDHPPKTAGVECNFDGRMLTLSCPTPGASIVWRFKGVGDPDHWELYTEPFATEEGLTVEIQAARIGYEFSEIQEFSVTPAMISN